MLSPLKHQLNALRIVLASGSPRRQELIQNIVSCYKNNRIVIVFVKNVFFVYFLNKGLSAELCPSLFEENLDIKDFDSFSAFVEETALQKVLEVSERLSKDDKKPELIVGGDTIVTLNGKMYGKPKTSEIAFQMLSELIGKQHVVYTGVVIKYNEKIVKFTESAKVYFGKATDEQIQAYVETGEPLDKAGGYGIQGLGGCMIEKIEGDYFTVMGLPLYRLSTEICKLFNYEIK